MAYMCGVFGMPTLQHLTAVHKHAGKDPCPCSA